MEKVILPKEVAEAIEEVWSEVLGKEGPTDAIKYAWLTNWQMLVIDYPKQYPNLSEYFRENPVDYVSALAYGYEVEKSPHEELREYYDSHMWVGRLDLTSKEKIERYGKRHGVRKTLNTLGIEIEGIND